MRSWALLVAVVLIVFSYSAPGNCADVESSDLIVRIYQFVNKYNSTALYGASEAARNREIAALKEKYAADLAKLNALAEKEKGRFKTIGDALARFEANIGPCAKCLHDARALRIDLKQLRACKKKYCAPEEQARHTIYEIAWKIDKGK